jgi:hypothetical protein
VTELFIQARIHPRNQWILVPLMVKGVRDLNMVLDTGAPFSSISDGTRDLLSAAGLLDHVQHNWYALRELSVQGQPIPDLLVHVSRRVSQAGAEGLMGLDFLRQFTDIHFHVPTLRLTLSTP